MNITFNELVEETDSSYNDEPTIVSYILIAGQDNYRDIYMHL
jgi:hypothetical protein